MVEYVASDLSVFPGFPFFFEGFSWFFKFILHSKLRLNSQLHGWKDDNSRFRKHQKWRNIAQVRRRQGVMQPKDRKTVPGFEPVTFLLWDVAWHGAWHPCHAPMEGWFPVGICFSSCSNSFANRLSSSSYVDSPSFTSKDGPYRGENMPSVFSFCFFRLFLLCFSVVFLNPRFNHVFFLVL